MESGTLAGKPTSFDIAELAGVSQPTVSRALRNSPTVNLVTRNRIHEIARQLNYKVDKNASNLRSRHSNTLALLLFEDPTPDDSMINPFFLAMLGSITRASARRGYDLLVSFQQLSSDWHTDYEDSRKADGLILLGYGDYRHYQERLAGLAQQGTHFVRWGSEVAGQPEVVVGCNNFEGGRSVTQHLIDLGRRAIAFIGGTDSGAPEFVERFAGYSKAMAGAGLATDPRLQVDASNAESAGGEAVRTLIARGAPFDAIVCASDMIAIGALRVLREAGLSVPGDVALTGFDDILAASFTNPPLTTVVQDVQAAGELLVTKLHELIHDGHAASETIPARLVVRTSSG
ncbi:MAG: LacI family DNA-binding transcriptional regulator [Pseudomonadota bacterium]